MTAIDLLTLHMTGDGWRMLRHNISKLNRSSYHVSALREVCDGEKGGHGKVN